MAISNKDLQSFIMGEGNLQKAKEMDLGSFLSSKDALGLANATDEEATAVKNLIDKTVDNQGIVPDTELDAAVGGSKNAGIIVGAAIGAFVAGASLGGGLTALAARKKPEWFEGKKDTNPTAPPTQK